MGGDGWEICVMMLIHDFMRNVMLKLSRDEALALDTKFSDRQIDLDPKGYFLIYVDRSVGLICADLYSNSINDAGVACDPVTGEPLPCSGKLERKPVAEFRGRTAKELCIALFETPQIDLQIDMPQESVIDRLDHAAYLGREAMRAEMALYGDEEYVQD
jgi:Domain of unknown function (DUF4346)